MLLTRSEIKQRQGEIHFHIMQKHMKSKNTRSKLTNNCTFKTRMWNQKMKLANAMQKKPKLAWIFAIKKTHMDF